ncbi:DUF1566 domain-containing protein [Candidatus Electronema sp. JM]|uniref:Lcl C-terminal domain-containing protein n=1 Tax=Candidatus Electronema sp. JM TaxID=3401571 RepID=UPI003AA7CC73
MKKVLFLLGLAVVAAEPSASFAANLALEMPPILAAKRDKCSQNADCASSVYGAYCCSGICTANHPCVNTCTTDANCTGSSYGNYCCGGLCTSNHPCVNTCTTDANCTGSSYGNYCCTGTCSNMSCPSASGTLNDTGIISKVGSSGQEDADFGRDANAATNSDSDGYKGFSFIKLDNNCTPLANQSLPYSQLPWSFVKDNVTGLIWQVNPDPLTPPNSSVIPDPKERPWYNDIETMNNGGNIGEYNGGSNTQAYVKIARGQEENNPTPPPAWCGKADWRLPTIKELAGLVNSSKSNTATEGNYFPNINLTNANSDKTNNAVFWSSTPAASNSLDAWAVNFLSGSTVRYGKVNINSVMLVRKAN